MFWDQAMWIVKLGGSLHDASSLEGWLRLVAHGRPPCVVVPGGGPFADAVRHLQRLLGFDDLAAHRMAILAMQQFGLHLHGLAPCLALAETATELRVGGSCIWLPWRLAGLEPEIGCGWDATSDSLACWLATRLEADVLLLVKSGAVPVGPRAAAELAQQDLVDGAFARFAASFPGAIRVLHRDHLPDALTLDWMPRACRVLAGRAQP
jgi:aspartokinase-like uncharacterized kinase